MFARWQNVWETFSHSRQPCQTKNRNTAPHEGKWVQEIMHHFPRVFLAAKSTQSLLWLAPIFLRPLDLWTGKVKATGNLKLSLLPKRFLDVYRKPIPDRTISNPKVLQHIYRISSVRMSKQKKIRHTKRGRCSK